MACSIDDSGALSIAAWNPSIKGLVAAATFTGARNMGCQ